MRSASAGRTFLRRLPAPKGDHRLDAPYVPLATFMIVMTSLCDRGARFFSIVAEIMFIDDVDEHDPACGPQHSDEGLGAQGEYEGLRIRFRATTTLLCCRKEGVCKKAILVRSSPAGHTGHTESVFFI